MDTAQNAIDFEASELLPRAITASIVIGPMRAQARERGRAGWEMGDLTLMSLAGDDAVFGSWAGDRIKGGQQSFTTNSIAPRAVSTRTKCLKRFKNRQETSRPSCSHRKYKLDRPVAGIDAAQSAIRLIVTATSTHNNYEVQHG